MGLLNILLSLTIELKSSDLRMIKKKFVMQQLMVIGYQFCKLKMQTKPSK